MSYISENWNLYTLFLETRAKLKEATAAFWTDHEIYTWLNDGQKDIARRLKCLRKITDINTTSSTQDYDLISEIPDFIMVDRKGGVYLKVDGSSTNLRRLAFTTEDDLDIENSGWRNVSAGIPRKYFYDKVKKQISLFPKPNSTNAGTDYLSISHYRFPKVLLAGTISSATSTTAVFAAGTATIPTPSVEDDYYNNLYIEIYSGIGQAQTKKITDYVGSSRTATVAWSTTPGSTSIFGMIPEVSEDMHYAMVLFASARAYEKAGEFARANNIWEQYVDRIKLGKADLEEEEDQMIVMRSYRDKNYTDPRRT